MSTTTTPDAPEAPKRRGWHYRSAEKLLKQAEQITVDFTQTPEVAIAKRASLASLHEMLVDRANTHALLANARESAFDQASDVWAHEYRAYQGNAPQAVIT